MPRKPKSKQAGRLAKNRKHRTRFPLPVVWGSGPFAARALDRWLAKRNGCDAAACETCSLDVRLSRLRRMYRQKRSRKSR